MCINDQQVGRLVGKGAVVNLACEPGDSMLTVNLYVPWLDLG
jgi:hypothetical protein